MDRITRELSIYVIAEGEAGPTKVGYGANPTKRVGELQIGNPRELTLYAAVQCDNASQVEAWVKQKLADHNIRGEWYSISPSAALEMVEEGVRLAQTGTPELFERYCGRCKTWKPLDQFYRNRRKMLGVQPQCKSCAAERYRGYAERNRAHINAMARNWKRRKRGRDRYSGAHEKAHMTLCLIRAYQLRLF